MDNFTPLKTEKKKTNKFLIFANLVLLVIVVGVTGFYLKNKLLTTEQKAAFIPTLTPIPAPTLTKTLSMINTITPTIAISLTPTATPTLTPTSTPAPTITPRIPSATPTEIIIAKISPTVVENLLETGTIKSIIYIIPSLIILLGLML